MANQNKHPKTSTALTGAAGLAGAVVGVGVAVAATKVLSDKKMRNRVKDILNNAKDQVLEAIDVKARNKGGQLLQKGQKRLTKLVKKDRQRMRKIEMPQLGA